MSEGAPIISPPPSPPPRRRLRAFLLFLLGIVVLILCDGVGESLGLLVPARHVLLAQLVGKTAGLLFLLAGFSLLLVGIHKIRERPLAAMGLDARARPLAQLAVGTLFGCAMVVLCVATIAGFGHLEFHVRTTAFALLRFVLVIAVIAVAAGVEEVGFRGYPFQRLVEAIGGGGALLVTSLLFGAMHAANPHVSRFAVANTALFGALMALAYLRTRQLWLPWGIHFGWNWALGALFGLPVSGFTFFAVVIKATATGPAALTGDSYGVEGSALGTTAAALGCVAVVLLTGSDWWRKVAPEPAPEAPILITPPATPASNAL